MLRAKELGIVPKTVAGKRGGGLGLKREKTPRSVKISKFAIVFDNMTMLNNEAPSTVSRAKGGSLKAAIKLKCLECCNGERTEIKDCQCGSGINPCPLYPFRPFQGKI
jgi:hypothetical protein